MLKTLVVINDFSSVVGGATSLALLSARLFRAGGFNVVLLAGDGGVNPELEQLGVTVVALGSAALLERESRSAAAIQGLYNRKAGRLLESWIAENDTPETVYHVHSWAKIWSPSIFKVLARVGKRTAISAHDYFLSCPNGAFTQFPQNRMCELTPMGLACLTTSCDKRGYAHKLWRYARHAVLRTVFDAGRAGMTILVVHEAMLPLLEKGGVPAARTAVLRNPATAWRADRVEAERNREIFYVGRLEQHKGVDLLAQAARIAAVPLRVIGSGPLEPAIASDYPEFRLMGWQSAEAVSELVGEARLLVLPSTWRETFGLVALEALQSGIAVVISKFALLAEEIEGEGFGVACDPFDVKTLAATLEMLSKDDAAIERMSRNGFERGRSLALSPDQWASRLLELYGNMVRLAAGSPFAENPVEDAARRA